MNKKALSLLLALSMVFSMNTIASAETTKTETPVVETQSTNSMNSRTVSEESVKVGSATVEVSYNKTPLFTGKKVDAAALNMTVTISAGSVSATNLKVTKIKFAKGYKKGNTGDVKFAVAKVDKSQFKALSKEQKKAVKAFYKENKKTTPFSIKIGKFSVSYNDVEVSNQKKPSLSASANYVLSVVFNKKGTKATVKVWSKNAKGKLKGVKVSKKNVTVSGKTVKLSGNYEGIVAISDNKAVKSVSAN